jgi:hypothetical protein
VRRSWGCWWAHQASSEGVLAGEFFLLNDRSFTLHRATCGDGGEQLEEMMQRTLRGTTTLAVTSTSSVRGRSERGEIGWVEGGRGVAG